MNYVFEDNTVYMVIENEKSKIKQAIGDPKRIELVKNQVLGNVTDFLVVNAQKFDFESGEYVKDLDNNDIVKVHVDGAEYDLQLTAGEGSFDYESPNVGEVEKVLVDGKEFDVNVV